MDMMKLANLLENNFQKDMQDKIYEIIEQHFDSYFEPKFKEAMSHAIDKYYEHGEGKVYQRTGQFSSGRGLCNIYISNGGRVIAGSAGEGFPSYPAGTFRGKEGRKYSRKMPWSGDLAWTALFDEGYHGTGDLSIGVTKPSPYKIVDEEMKNHVNDFTNNYLNKFILEAKDQILNGYYRACM